MLPLDVVPARPRPSARTQRRCCPQLLLLMSAYPLVCLPACRLVPMLVFVVVPFMELLLPVSVCEVLVCVCL